MLDDPLINLAGDFALLPVDAIAPSTERLLLSRRKVVVSETPPVYVAQGQAGFDPEWVSTPQESRPVYAALYKTVIDGAARQYFDHVPPVYLRLQRASGAAATYGYCP